MAMRNTSTGKRTTSVPLSANIITMVNNKAHKANGEILGKNTCWYQASPRQRSNTLRVSQPKANGTPKYSNTDCHTTLNSIATMWVFKPNTLGK